MYDSNIDDQEYHNLRARVSAWVNGDESVSLGDLMQEIEEAYDYGAISGSAYDNLIGILEDYL